MAKPLLKKKALELRDAGWSYSQIRQQLGVSKGTLSVWLEGRPLSEERIRELRDNNAVRIERYRETRRRNREALMHRIYNEERSRILPMSPREEFLCGLFLYWGEGLKAGNGSFSLSNTDARMMRFFVRWTVNVLKVDAEKMRVRLHIYSDMDAQKELRFWSRALSIPLEQFRKTQIKKTKLKALTYKKGFGHGTCEVIVHDAIMCKRILMGIKAIGDFYGGPVA